MSQTFPNNDLVISYMMLRKAIGLLGVALPFLVAVGALLIFRAGLQHSISAYYHTGMRDVFVGTLCAIGFFLFSYKGHERRDAIAGNLACVFAVGVALFPTAPEGASCFTGQLAYCPHGAFAALLFLTLTFFSLFLFTKTDPTKTPTPQKLKRNAVYKVCGCIMLSCILLVPVLSFFEDTAPIRSLNPVFWLEAIAIVAFGISWLVKGEAILGDDT